MAATHNYYRILGIKTTAGVQEIRQAIHALREKDTAGNYTATLNAIEETLSDPEKRGAYDDQLGVDRGGDPLAQHALGALLDQSGTDVHGSPFSGRLGPSRAVSGRLSP